MEREKIIAIMEEMLFVSDEWGGSKLANWEYGFNVVVDGIEDTVDAIIASASQPVIEADTESRCPQCGETEPDLHCAKCGHSWYRTA